MPANRRLMDGAAPCSGGRAGNLCALTIEAFRRGAEDSDIDYGAADRITALQARMKGNKETGREPSGLGAAFRFNRYFRQSNPGLQLVDLPVFADYRWNRHHLADRALHPQTSDPGGQLSTGVLLVSQGVRLMLGISTFQTLRQAAEPFPNIQRLGSVPVGLVIGTLLGILTLLDRHTRKEMFVPILVLGITLASNLAAGFLIGIAVA